MYVWRWFDGVCCCLKVSLLLLPSYGIGGTAVALPFDLGPASGSFAGYFIDHPCEFLPWVGYRATLYAHWFAFFWRPKTADVGAPMGFRNGRPEAALTHRRIGRGAGLPFAVPLLTCPCFF